MHNIVPVNLYSSINGIGVSRRSNVYPILTDLGQPRLDNDIGTIDIVSAIFPSSSGRKCYPTRRKADWI